MRCIDGYVCIAKTSECAILFGENKGEGHGNYENIESNDFSLYKTKKAARKGQTQLKKRKNFLEVTLGKLKMDIAENAGELERIADSKSLAVIKFSDFGKVLMGERIEGTNGACPIPGAYMANSNYKPFTSLERAKYVASEVNRQAQCGIQIATFKLEKIR